MDFKQAGLEVIHAAKKEGLNHVDALIERTEELEVQIRDNKVEKVEQSTSLGLGIRVLNQGRSGFASTEKLDPQTIQKTPARRQRAPYCIELWRRASPQGRKFIIIIPPENWLVAGGGWR